MGCNYWQRCKRFIVLFCCLFFMHNISLAYAGGCSGPLKTNADDVYMQANKLEYFDDTKTYYAAGKVDIYYEQYRLKADKLDYNPTTGDAHASGHVTLYDFGSDTIITAKDISLNKDFSLAVAKGVNALRKNNIRATANHIERIDDNTTVMKNISYTPCTFESHKSKPIWSVSAERVIDDASSEDVTYENASFNIFGSSIITVPEFTYPRPSVKRRSGLLAPEFSIETDNGIMVSTPYFYAIDESKDLTIQPIFYTENSTVLRNRYRHKSNFGYVEADTAFTFADVRNNNNQVIENDKFRGSILSQGRFHLGSNHRVGFDFNRVTDDAFLQRFDLSDPTFLQSRLFYSNNDQYQNLYIGAYGFQITDGITDEDTVPIILPMIDYDKQLRNQFIGGDIFLKGNFMAIHRADGVDTRRAITSAKWQRNFDLPYGLVLNLGNELRGDLYHTTQGVDPGDSNRMIENGFTGRVIPTSSAKFSLPLVKKTENAIQVLEPAFQAVWSPYGANPDNIPNEDGFATEFDASGLFDTQRFYGYDLVESGPRFNTGIRYLYHIPKTGGFEAQFGQSYRLKSESRFASYTGLDGKHSDYVGRFVINYKDFIHLTHRYRLKNNNFGLGLSDLTFDAGNDKMRLSVSHFTIDDFEAGTIFNNSEQLLVGFRGSMTPNWHIMTGYRQNINTQSTLETRGGLMYTDECLVASIAVGREFIRFNDVEPSTTVRFRIRLLATGNENL